MSNRRRRSVFCHLFCLSNGRLFPIIGLACFLFFLGKVQGESIKGIDKKIKAHQRELKKLKERARTLETEKNELKQEEKKIIKTLKKTESEIEQSSYKQVQLVRRLHGTESEIRDITQQLALFSQEGFKREESIIADLQNYHVHLSYPQRLQKKPMESWLVKHLISLKYAELKKVKNKKDLALKKEEELLNSKNNLIVLKSRLGKELQKQKESKLAQDHLYRTLQDKRIIAEQEAQRLNETSESLETLVSKLLKKKEKSLATQHEAEQLKKEFQKRRGSFPWPVDGKVISRYGRDQHPTLNITVINSGIKIKTKPNTPVRSIEKGTVIYAADFRSYGPTVIIDHGGENYSVYGLLGNLLVEEGEGISVEKVLGTTTSQEESQLYFEFRNQGHAEDPLLWLK